LGKKKYTAELKMEIVQAVLRNGKTADEAAKDYAIDKALIRKWVASYQQNGTEGVERKFTSYTPEFKLEVIENMRANQLSYRATAIKYNIGMHTTVKQWERKYLEGGYDELRKDGRGRSDHPKIGRPPALRKEVRNDLIAENQRLKMENEYLKKLNALIRIKGK